MKSILSLTLCLFLMSSSAPKLSKNWVLENTKIYSPFTYTLLSEYANYPTATVSVENTTISNSMKPFEFIDFTDEKSILQSISTSVHETMHAFNGFIPLVKKDPRETFKMNDEGYMIGVDQFKILNHVDAPLFQSKEMVVAIPESLRTFRFDTYIKGIPNMTSTQSSGIYGLLDEFLAYYSGSKVVFDLKPLFIKYYGEEAGYMQWSTEFSSNQCAFYEFDFYVKEYLLFAKRRFPVLYDQLKADVDFREVYQTIQTKFIELTHQYEKDFDQFKALHKKANGMGVTYIYSKFNEDIYNVLEPQLKSNRYDVIEQDFGVK